jgi:hypothetical protein
MPTAPKKPALEFDNQKLEKLQEPITVTVYRLAGGNRELVVLPTRPEESVPGKGFTRDDVRQLEQFLAEKWTGAGNYECAATGANGEPMKWKFYASERNYPTMHQGQVIAQPNQPQQQALQGVQPTPLAATGWLGGLPQPQAPAPQPQLQLPWSQPALQSNWMSQAPIPPVSYPGQQIYPPPNGVNQVQQEREARIAMENRLERERSENQHKEAISALSTEMRNMQAQMMAKPGETEEVKLLKEQLRAMEAKQSDEKLVAMIADSNRQNREMMREMQQQMMQLINAKPSGPDPTMMLVVEAMKASTQQQAEAARANSDAQKEIARIQADAQREAARQALGPQDMINLVSRMSVGQEQLAMGYSKVMEMMQQGIETVMTAQGPGTHPALELVGQAAQGGLEVAQNFVQMKKEEAIANAQAQAVAAQAQAQAAVAQSRPASPQLNAAEEEPEEAEEETIPSAEAPPQADVDAAERELFGLALPKVKELREAVAAGTLDPQQTATAIVGGISEIANRKIKAKITDAWAQGDLATLVDAILPGLTTSFQETVISTLYDIRNQMLAQAQGQQPPQPEA